MIVTETPRMYKSSPQRLAYWKEYRVLNNDRIKAQRKAWREENRPKIRLCARRCYYRRKLRECDPYTTEYRLIQQKISMLDQEMALLGK